MYVYIIGTNNKQMEVGNPQKMVYIPKQGEQVNTGFEPYAKVTNVAYDYKQNCIYVVVDGPILDR